MCTAAAVAAAATFIPTFLQWTYHIPATIVRFRSDICKCSFLLDSFHMTVLWMVSCHVVSSRFRLRHVCKSTALCSVFIARCSQCTLSFRIGWKCWFIVDKSRCNVDFYDFAQLYSGFVFVFVFCSSHRLPLHFIISDFCTIKSIRWRFSRMLNAHLFAL